MSSDRIEKFGHSVIQHGARNDRIYLMKLGEEDLPQIAGDLVEMAKDRGYSKIFAKIPATALASFTAQGFIEEARIPGFFGGQQAALFLGKFLSLEREKEDRAERIEQVLQATRHKTGPQEIPQLTQGQSSRVLCKADNEEMSRLYRQVFASYPFPIHDPDYLARTMDENVIYFGIWAKDRLVALASAEVDVDQKNAEMTDFATLPECRGKGFANILLRKMEAHILQIGIRTAYTIARAYSFGMNITFARQGYRFGGTLTKNTQISGGLETMNIWYKQLQG